MSRVFHMFLFVVAVSLNFYKLMLGIFHNILTQAFVKFMFITELVGIF